MSVTARLEVDADLGADHEGVGDVPGTARPDNVLQVGLNEVCPVAKTKVVNPLQHCFLILDANRRIQLLGEPFGAAQVSAELAVIDSKAGHVPRPLPEDAADFIGGNDCGAW